MICERSCARVQYCMASTRAPTMDCCTECILQECVAGGSSLALNHEVRRCATFTGASEAQVKLHTCSVCRTAQYCGPLCQKAAWRAHRAACRRREAAPG